RFSVSRQTRQLRDSAHRLKGDAPETGPQSRVRRRELEHDESEHAPAQRLRGQRLAGGPPTRRPPAEVELRQLATGLLPWLAELVRVDGGVRGPVGMLDERIGPPECLVTVAEPVRARMRFGPQGPE